MSDFAQWMYDVKDGNTSSGWKIFRKKSKSQGSESQL